MIVSYAQNFEDVILWRALRNIQRGFYIDIGAQDPIEDSVSMSFYEAGWRGVHVEPVKAYADMLRKARPGEEVIEAAISTKKGEIEFFEFAKTGLSTGLASIAQLAKDAGRTATRITVKSLPLSTILDRYADRDIHWLKIDVEGMERRVLKSWAPSKVRPWIVVIESTAPGTNRPTHEEWEKLLVAKGYKFGYFDGVNRFYLSAAHRALKRHFGPGPNCFDDFSTSNQGICRAALSGLREELLQSAALLNAERQKWASREAELHSEIASHSALVKTMRDEHAAADLRLSTLITQKQDLLGVMEEQNAEREASLVVDFNEQIAQLTNQLNTKEARVELLESTLMDQVHMLQQAEAKQRQLADQIATERVEKEALQRNLDREIASQKTNLDHLTSSFADQVANLAVEKGECFARLGQAETALARLRQENAERDVRLAFRGSEQTSRLAELQRVRVQLEAEHHSLSQRVHDLEAELNTLNDRKTELERVVSEMSGQASRLHSALVDMRNSTSWRVTAPFRTVIRGIRAIRSLPKAAAHSGLSGALAWVRRNPEIKERIHVQLTKMPRLKRRIDAFASAHPARPSLAKVLEPGASGMLATKSAIAVNGCGTATVVHTITGDAATAPDKFSANPSDAAARLQPSPHARVILRRLQAARSAAQLRH